MLPLGVTTARAVVGYIRQLQPDASHKKLQKLLYYAEAWSMVWDGRALFSEDFEAWVQGPVVRSVYASERYPVPVPPPPPDVELDPTFGLAANQRKTIEAVVSLYGSKSGDWLSRLTHREAPWRTARKGLASTEQSKNRISKVEMAAFYSSSRWGDGKSFSPDFVRGLELLVSMPEDEVATMNDAASVTSEEHLRWLETGEEA